MRRRVAASAVMVGALALGACTDGHDSGRAERPRTASAARLVGGRTDAQTAPTTTTTPSAPTPATVATTAAPSPTGAGWWLPYWWIRRATATTTTTAAPTTTVAPTTTTIPVPVPGQPNPFCMITVVPGDSLDAIAAAARARLDDAEITYGAIQIENAIPNPDRINAGQVLDVCPNGFDDTTGAERPKFVPPPPLEVPQGGTNFGSGVVAQQQKLNELLTPYGFPALDTDGQPGRLTRQALCAARMGLGLPASREPMEPNSAEEMQLQAAGGLRIPARSDTGYRHWALIDLHCQVLFAGEGRDRIRYVFPISSGEGEYPTRLQSASRAFRYDPARANDGWHDSRDYPVTVDNPLNGNMYKPVYFDGGQAIHGANSVPTSPASKGCIRMRVGHQEMFIQWLGLADVDRELWDARDRIGLTVTIIGSY